ncbi:MAG: hypothetical protein ABIO40_08455 [Devosia sp.]
MDEPVVEAVSDWNGFYAGIGIDVQNSTTIVEHLASFQAVVGANAQMDSFLLGVEGYGAARFSDITGWYYAFGVEGRAGVVISDAAVVYGALGVETVGSGTYYRTMGLGVEFMVADNTSVDLEYKRYEQVGGGWNGDAISAQLLWHFN